MTDGRSPSFLGGVWAGTAALLVWAAHFASSYVVVAATCTRAVASGGDAPGALRWVLVGTTVLAASLLAAMFWRACAPERGIGHLQTVKRVCAVLAFIGVVWTGIPLALLPLCTA